MPRRFRPAFYPGQWSPRQQPPMYDRMEVDWGHPLTTGLIGCYLPTSTIRDASGNAPTIVDLSSAGNHLIVHDGSSTFSLSPVGFGNNGNGEFASASGWYAASTPAQQPASTASGFFVGYVNDGGDLIGYPLIIGSTYTTNAGTSPYDAFDLRRPGSDATALSFSWNVGGTQGNVLVSGLLATGASLSGGFTLNCNGVAGNARLFANGTVAGTATPTSGTISYSSPQMCFNGAPGQQTRTGMATTIGYVWSRALSDGEMAWLHAEPYVLLRPVRRRRFVGTASASAGAGARVVVMA